MLEKSIKARSFEQIVEAAMCAWECIDDLTLGDYGTPVEPVWLAMRTLRQEIGSPAMRYHTGQIAKKVSIAFAIAENAANGYYDEPFDWEFVPSFLANALDVDIDNACFKLKPSWKNVAYAMGLSLKR